MLLQFAARAKWLSEAEELLWTIVKLYPEDLIAAQGWPMRSMKTVALGRVKSPDSSG